MILMGKNTTVKPQDGKLYLKFQYAPKLIDEIKNMDGARWHPEIKAWSINDNQRNQFQLAFLQGQNPYARYDKPLIDYTSSRPLYSHQLDMIRTGLTVHYCLFAAEPGTGKSLAAIEIMEASGLSDWWWIGPKSALVSVQLELWKWKSKITPKLFTYESLKKQVKYWEDGKKAPHGIIFDECHRIKTPTALRSQAARIMADGVRDDWGDDGFILGMSGSPAPKEPSDWYNQIETIQPGFLKEGNIIKFKKRLCLIEQRNSIQGGVYPHVITWLDDENKCGICGELEDHITHQPNSDLFEEHQYHKYQKSVNEVAKLYNRMKGIVVVKFKKDCLDLPDKIYKVIKVVPTPSVINAARLIATQATRTIEALTLLRELSDGFQYQQIEHKELCKYCNGNGQVILNYLTAPSQITDCVHCGGSGKITTCERKTTQVECPKEQALIDILDEYEDVGRVVIGAGFTGSVDRVVDICKSCGWSIIRVDGRGWIQHGLWGVESSEEMVQKFQDKSFNGKIAFIGQQESAGAGLTLTASPVLINYSNTFKPDARQQFIDRIHRPGMDVNRGATIIDLVHLPTDQLVLDKLEAKIELQNMSLGLLKEVLDS